MAVSETTLDPFTVEIIKDALIAVGDEMFITLQRTSKSPIIYEVLDFATGLTNAEGDLITQGNGVAGFLGTLTQAVRFSIEKFGPDGLVPGDVVITNDPYTGGGTHLSDVTLVLPIFRDGQLVAFSACKAHWTEVGGKDPGSWTTDSTEVFQEGLQLPCLKLYEAGRRNDAIVEIIGANVRLPDSTLGDLEAQLAAVRVAERRFIEVCAKHGVAQVEAAIEALLDYGERATLIELAKLPVGIYEAEDWIDDDGVGSGPLPIRVKVTIAPDRFVCDFTGSHPQVLGPVNSTVTGLHSAVRCIFKAVTDPSIAVNDGCFRPLEVICPSGTVFTAARPAAVSTYWETMLNAADLVWKALAPVVPHRLTAGHLLSVCGVVVAGDHPDSGELFLLVEPLVGGWGAANDRDGVAGQYCLADGETYNIPIEVAETRYGLLVESYALDVTPAGAGRFRGGRGCIREYRALTDVTFTGTFGRHVFLPWGVEGGREGSPNAVQFVKSDGSTETAGKTARHPVARGELIRLITATGGGWGDPLARPAAEVIADIQEGYVTVEQAQDDYGLIIDPETYELLGESAARAALDAGPSTDGGGAP